MQGTTINNHARSTATLVSRRRRGISRIRVAPFGSRTPPRRVPIQIRLSVHIADRRERGKQLAGLIPAEIFDAADKPSADA